MTMALLYFLLGVFGWKLGEAPAGDSVPVRPVAQVAPEKIASLSDGAYKKCAVHSPGAIDCWTAPSGILPASMCCKVNSDNTTKFAHCMHYCLHFVCISKCGKEVAPGDTKFCERCSREERGFKEQETYLRANDLLFTKMSDLMKGRGMNQGKNQGKGKGKGERHTAAIHQAPLPSKEKCVDKSALTCYHEPKAAVARCCANSADDAMDFAACTHHCIFGECKSACASNRTENSEMCKRCFVDARHFEEQAQILIGVGAGEREVVEHEEDTSLSRFGNIGMAGGKGKGKGKGKEGKGKGNANAKSSVLGTSRLVVN